MALREPCELTRSPIIAGRGSCTSGVAAIMLDTCGGRGAGRGPGVRPATRSASALMCSGVVPQQPPTIDRPKRSTNSPSVSASGPGCSGKIVSPFGPWIGMPALGMQCTGTGDHSPRKRIASRMSSGPVEQFSPITSTLSASSVVSTASMSVPSSILPPLGSSETEAWIGTRRPVSLNASRTPKIEALTSRMSCAVSTITRSTPPSSRPCACSVNVSTSSRKLIWPRVGSSEAGRWPVGPIEPATKRCSPTALRAISAARRLISSVWSPRPHSPSLIRLAWKVSVSTTSAPASIIEAWTPSITSGRLSTSASWARPGSL